MAQEVELIAFGRPEPPYLLEPAPRWRDWMNATRDRWANRCLPLLMANESGWVLLNRYGFSAVWNGDDRPVGVTITYDEPDQVPTPPPVQQYFGYGTLTWTVPYLFRTPPGYNLLARGPANWPKDGLCALEGLVETDWAVASFTMNWKFTRPDHPIRFDAGEPYAMIVPQRRGELQAFHPHIHDLKSDPEMHASYRRWADARHEISVGTFLSDFSSDVEVDEWQGDYFRGRTHDGREAPEHQRTLRLRAWTEPAPPEA